MSAVETVNGKIDTADLGLTLIHEHVRCRDEAVAENWPSRYDAQAEFDAAIDAVTAAKAHGVQSIVDPTAMFGGRDVRFMERVADEAGINIVACTGIYTYDFLPHYSENRGADMMAAHFVEDIERGVQGTQIKAAFLKCAADAAGVTRTSRRCIARARARACKQEHRSWLTRCRPPTPARVRSRSSSRRASRRRRSRSPTAETAQTSSTSRPWSTAGSTSGMTATATRCTSLSITATR